MSSNRPVIRVRFVYDVDQTAIGLRLGTATGKIWCTGELPSSDWEKPKRTDRLKRCMYVPYMGMYDEIHVDVDKARCTVRLWATSDAVSLDILVHLPDDRCAVVGELYAHECPALIRPGSWLVLSLPSRWWSLTRQLSVAGLEADEGAWAATWAAIRRLAIEELPAAADCRVREVSAATGLPDDVARIVVGRETLALFEDPATRAAGWSRGACATALWAVQECAWKAWTHAGAPNGEAGRAAGRLMEQLLAECDIGADEALEMVKFGLSRCERVKTSIDETVWAVVDNDECGRRLFVHRSIMDRFALQAPIAVTTFEWMPL